MTVHDIETLIRTQQVVLPLSGPATFPTDAFHRGRLIELYAKLEARNE